MQIGVMHYIGGIVGLFLVVAGAFTAGTQWHTEPEANTASVASASEESVTTAEEETNKDTTETGERLYTVVKVVDGDTITIDLGEKNETIRLIGIDTPETSDSRTGVQCFGKEATAKLKSVIGDRVSIEKDAGEGERDKYDRLLAYVYNEEGTMLNKYLIAQGYAYEYTYDDPYKYQKEFKAAEADAKKNTRGLWAPNACPEPAKSKTSTIPKQTAAAAAVMPVVMLPTSQPTTTATHLSAQQEVVEEKKAEPKPEPKSEPEPEPEPKEPQSADSYTCSKNTYNCSHFKTQAEAQSVFEQCGGIDNDVHRLDSNKDGEVCESLP